MSPLARIKSASGTAAVAIAEAMAAPSAAAMTSPSRTVIILRPPK
jgi:hypothetical protein